MVLKQSLDLAMDSLVAMRVKEGLNLLKTSETEIGR